MKRRVSLSLAQALTCLVILVLAGGGIMALSFWSGLRAGRMQGRSEATARTSGTQLPETPLLAVLTSPPAVGTLPRGMTATPREKQPQSLTFTDETAAQEMQKGIAAAGSETQFEIVSLAIHQEGITLQGRIDGLGYHGPVEMVGSPVVTNGKLHFHLERVSVSGQGLPAFMYPSLEGQIDAYFARWLYGYEVQSVELEEGKLTVVVVPW
jgi:hypothetical protein